MRTLVRARQRIDWQMGRLLRTFFALRLHRLMGFPSAAAYARERLGLSPRKAFQPIRVAVTGSTVSPGLFESIELLGRQETLARLDAAL